MGLHKKLDALASLGPDVAVIPEAAEPTMQAPLQPDQAIARTSAWIGPNKKKGLAVIAYGNHSVEPCQRGDGDLSDALAVKVTGPLPFTLVGVWARAPKYVQHLHDVLDAWGTVFRSGDVVMAGDFNSNAIWDRLHGSKCHTSLVKRLESEFGLVSAYHVTRNQPHGGELEPTFFWRDNKESPYHIDYAFIPKRWVARVRSVRILGGEPWRRLSDHLPLVLDLEGPPASC
jgi:hypothetical protein